MCRVHKITPYQNAEGVERICITIKQAHPVLAITAFGSINAREGAKLEDIEEAYEVGKDVSDELRLGAKLDTDGPFFRVHQV